MEVKFHYLVFDKAVGVSDCTPFFAVFESYDDATKYVHDLRLSDSCSIEAVIYHPHVD